MILNTIKKSFLTTLDQGVLPSLLILNKETERLLFTDGSIPKNENAEDFFLNKKNGFSCELLVTDLKTEPQFYGTMRTDDKAMAYGDGSN